MGLASTRSEKQRVQRLADQRAETDQDIAEQRRQDDTLQAYLDQVGELMLDKDNPLRKSKYGGGVRRLARARTLTVLARLSANRKRHVLRFLYV